MYVERFGTTGLMVMHPLYWGQLMSQKHGCTSCSNTCEIRCRLPMVASSTASKPTEMDDDGLWSALLNFSPSKLLYTLLLCGFAMYIDTVQLHACGDQHVQCNSSQPLSSRLISSASSVAFSFSSTLI